jgi:hypothetical protein
LIGALGQWHKIARQHFIDEIIIADQCEASTIIEIIETGRELAVFDGTPVVGDIACAPPASTGAVGLAHDNGTTACPAGQKPGVVAGQALVPDQGQQPPYCWSSGAKLID